jgi:hypothetical protein
MVDLKWEMWIRTIEATFMSRLMRTERARYAPTTEVSCVRISQSVSQVGSLELFDTTPAMLFVLLPWISALLLRPLLPK